MTWINLLNIAKDRLNSREVSPFIEAGGVSAVILTENGNVYQGVCIDTACSLGICAERNAIGNMITNGESKITKLVCVRTDGSAILPCGSCQEFLMQLHKDSPFMEILVDIDTETTITLEQLMPNWWGSQRFL